MPHKYWCRQRQGLGLVEPRLKLTSIAGMKVLPEVQVCRRFLYLCLFSVLIIYPATVLGTVGCGRYGVRHVCPELPGLIEESS